MLPEGRQSVAQDVEHEQREERRRHRQRGNAIRLEPRLGTIASADAGTRGIVNAERLALMKPSAMLINTARGEMVDEDALVAALAEKRLAGAGLDVMAQEPPPADPPLFKFDNVVLTPHLATITDLAYRNMCVEVATQVAHVLQGKPPDIRNVRNPQVINP